MLIRETIEEREEIYLSSLAKKSKYSGGRKSFEEQDSLRTCFMRDRDRIIHCEAFRRLKHKTQVFLSPTNDTYRTRLTHTLEVSQIARTIARALNLNEDLTEAISLGHDAGHTPFGHCGELVIQENAYHDFKHSDQSVRVLEILEHNRKGLNLTLEVLDGIKKHSKTGLKHIMPQEEKDYPMTLEAEVVRVSDIIAYVNHDIDDAVKSGILKENDLPEDTKLKLGENHSNRINTLVKDVVNSSRDKDHISMSSEIITTTEDLRAFLFSNVYKHPVITSEIDKAKNILHELYKLFKLKMNIVYEKLNLMNYLADKDETRALVDFIASMTDNEAINLYYRYFIPKSFYII